MKRLLILLVFLVACAPRKIELVADNYILICEKDRVVAKYLSTDTLKEGDIISKLRIVKIKKHE